MNEYYDLSKREPQITASQLKEKALKKIAENIDNREKKIGDIVKVWDGSANFDKNTSEERAGIDPLFKNNTAIIIETNCDNQYIPKYSNKTYILDVLLKFPSGEEIYCDSSMIKRIDNYEK